MTEAMATMIAPPPRARKMFVGTISMPSSEITTTMPLKSTAREAVSPAISIAASFSRPSARSSRKRSTMKSV